MSGGEGVENADEASLHIKQLPALLGTQVETEALDGVAVLLALVLDAAEDEDPSVAEVARRVVVAALVQTGHLQPVVRLGIVDLHLLGSLVHLFPRPRDHHIAVLDLAAAVAVSSEPHALLLHKLQIELGRVGLGDHFSALEHAVRQSLEVSAANHEYTWCDLANLDHLEVVREIASELDELVLELTGGRAVRSDRLAVLLENVDGGWEVELLHLLDLALVLLELLGDGLPSSLLLLLLLSLLLGQVDIGLELAPLGLQLESLFAGADVAGNLTVHVGLAAARTDHLQQLKHVFDLLVHRQHLAILVALRTAHSILSSSAGTTE